MILASVMKGFNNVNTKACTVKFWMIKYFCILNRLISMPILYLYCEVWKSCNLQIYYKRDTDRTFLLWIMPILLGLSCRKRCEQLLLNLIIFLVDVFLKLTIGVSFGVFIINSYKNQQLNIVFLWLILFCKF